MIPIYSPYPPISDHHNLGVISNHPQIISYDDQSGQHPYNKKMLIRRNLFRTTGNEIQNVSIQRATCVRPAASLATLSTELPHERNRTRQICESDDDVGQFSASNKSKRT